MKISMLQLRVRPENVESVVAEYSNHRILSQSGAEDAWLFVKDDVVTVVARWKSAHEYSDWLTNPLRTESAQRLAALVEEVVESYLTEARD